jgi:hypothetical protein
MATKIIEFECPGCHSSIPLEDTPNFCTFCGHKLGEEDIKTLTFPICPSEILEGHCEECEEGKYKKCDDCGNTEDVEYRPKWGDKCLCRSCREREATFASLTRSW